MEDTSDYFISLPSSAQEKILELAEGPFDFEELPPELWRHVAVFLSYEDLMNLCRTNREVRMNICGDDAFWYIKILEDYGEPTSKRESWRNTYEIYREDSSKEAILHIDNKKYDEALNIIERGVTDVNFVWEEEEGTTLLDTAIEYDQPKIVKELLKLGADPNHYSGASNTYPIEYAMGGNPENTEMVTDIFTYGGTGRSLVSRAARYGNEELVRLFLINEEDPNEEYDNMSGLELVAEFVEGDVGERIARLLIDAEVPISRYALELTYINDNSQVRNVFLEHGMTPLTNKQIDELMRRHYG